jgi:hypothetical protein
MPRKYHGEEEKEGVLSAKGRKWKEAMKGGLLPKRGIQGIDDPDFRIEDIKEIQRHRGKPKRTFKYRPMA